MTTLAQALDEVCTLQTELAAVRAQLDWLRKKVFGGGQGERLDRAQLLFQIGQLEQLADRGAPRRVATAGADVRPVGRSHPAADDGGVDRRSRRVASTRLSTHAQ